MTAGVREAEVMTVGTDEVVVTFVTDPGVAVTSRVGDQEQTTVGPHHFATFTGLEPVTEYPVTVDGAPAALTGESWSAGPFTLQEGPRTFAIVATDAGGLQDSVDVTVVLDSEAPSVVVTTPAPEALFSSPETTVSGQATDAHLETVTVNGLAASVSGSSFTASAVPLQEGETTLRVEATDAVGHTTEVTRTVVRDAKNPSIQITDPAAGTIVPGESIEVRGTAVDPHLDRVTVDGRVATLIPKSLDVVSTNTLVSCSASS
jgi:uncharacterized Zn-binding protein involved in type VI secretion